MTVLMTHLIASEQKERAEEAHVNFKTQVFAANPELYQQIFADERVPEDDEVEWIVPESEEDFQKMLGELD